MADKIRHSGFVSFCPADNPIPWYTTKEDNEIIRLKDHDGQHRNANSILFQAKDVTIYIKPGDSKYCLVIDPYHSYEYNYERISEFQVIAPIGTSLRWYAQFF